MAEAYQILDMAESSGLVISTSNTKMIACLCCCCPCCCTFFRYSKFLPKPNEGFKFYYQSKIDKKKCRSCGNCINKCPMGAILNIDEHILIDLKRCIGCGLCVSVCQAKAISLNLVEGIEDPPNFVEDLFGQIDNERRKRG